MLAIRSNDRQGSSVKRFLGFDCFECPEETGAVTETPAPVFTLGATLSPWSTIAKPWQAPLVHRPSLAGFSCYRSENRPDLHTCQEMAQAVLSGKEFHIWSHLRWPFGRRRQWLLGRLCVKRAIQSATGLAGGEGQALHEIKVLADKFGKPIVFARQGLALNGCFLVSIAHSEDVVVGIAGACEDLRGVGIDVEPLGRNTSVLEKAALHYRERVILRRRVRYPKLSEWLIRIWCAKEALAKAIGYGMRGGPLCFVVEDLDTGSGNVKLHLEGKAAHRCSEWSGRSFVVSTGREKETVYAISVLS